MTAAPPVDLNAQRGVSGLFGETFRLYGRYAGLFSAVTFVVVVPIVLLVDGVWSRGFDGDADNAPIAAMIASLLLHLFVVPAMVTALHVVIVQRLAEGRVPAMGEAFAAAGERLGPAIGAVALSSVIVFAGLLAFVIPGIWLMVRLYFAAQSAVVDGASPAEALGNSSELVKGRWWRVFGRLLLSAIVFGVLGGWVEFLPEGTATIIAHALSQTIILSLTALFGTLLFFELRAAPSSDRS